ncbi:MAG: hypothetical protein WD965_06650 [Actinomycetota bacterium]
MRNLLGACALALSLAACSGDSGREFATYYDPEGFFVTNLPAAHDLSVTPPQSAGDGPGLLTGVLASPPQPSPAAAPTTTAFNLAPEEPQDQTIYEALAIVTSGFDDLDQMGLYFLTGDPAIDVQIDDPIRIDGHEGRLLVADITQNGQATASLAAAMTLGENGTGFLVAAVFPPGRWEAEREDFFRVLGSFRANIPPGLETFPVTGGAP